MKKTPWTIPRKIWKWNDNLFFDFFKYWLKLSKFLFSTNIWAFSFQIYFQSQFLTSGNSQTRNAHFHFRAFSSWSPSQSPKSIPKEVLEWKGQYFCSKVFLERIGPYFKKSKNGFHIVFSNLAFLAWQGSGGYFHARTLNVSPNALYLPPKQLWGPKLMILTSPIYQNMLLGADSSKITKFYTGVFDPVVKLSLKFNLTKYQPE